MGKGLLIILLFCSCYNQQKAAQQFSRAVVFDPKLPAEYCAVTFPARDTVIRDTVTTSDTLYYPPEFVTDTVREHDTVTITRTVTLPGKVITNTVTIRDTIYRENTAALKSCQIDNSRLVANTGILTVKRNKARRGRDTWRLIAIISLVINGAGLFFKLRKLIPG